MEILFALLALSAFSIYFVFFRPAATSHPLPPGPKPRFIVGNLMDMPRSSGWLTFTEWGKKYGLLLKW
jgi:hypothetical protein